MIHTKFSAWNQDEFRTSVPYHGRRMSSLFQAPRDTLSDLPVEQDFSSKFGPVRNQFRRDCNASWDFVAADVMTYLSGRNISSEYLLNCIDTLKCTESSVDNALTVMRRQACFTNEYEEYGCSCATTKVVRRFQQIHPDFAQRIASWRPIASGVYVGPELQFYGGGVIYGEFCHGELPTHGVIITGYGKTDDGVPYWKVRNSWGSDWGENGYFRIIRGENACGIETELLQIQATTYKSQ